MNEQLSTKDQLAKYLKALMQVVREDEQAGTGYTKMLIGYRLDDIHALFAQQAAQLAAANEQLQEFRDYYDSTLAEACNGGHPDELHCTCVPGLRQNVKELTAQLAAAEAREREAETQRDKALILVEKIGHALIELDDSVTTCPACGADNDHRLLCMIGQARDLYWQAPEPPEARQ